jgi:hypothetical protein
VPLVCLRQAHPARVVVDLPLTVANSDRRLSFDVRTACFIGTPFIFIHSPCRRKDFCGVLAMRHMKNHLREVSCAIAISPGVSIAGDVRLTDIETRKRIPMHAARLATIFPCERGE